MPATMQEIPIAALDAQRQKLVESARAAYARENFALTVELCREVLGTAPGCLPVRKLHRAAQLKRGARSDVAVLFRRVSTAPFLFSGNLALGQDPAKSLQCAQTLLDADPRSAAGLKLLGAAATRLNWPETAVFAFAALRELVPQSGEALVALGRAHLGAGRAAVAVQCAEAALRLEPHDAAAQELLKEASVTETMQQGRWGESGDFRGKLRGG